MEANRSRNDGILFEAAFNYDFDVIGVVHVAPGSNSF